MFILRFVGGILVRRNKIPSTARDILIYARDRRVPMFSSALSALGPLGFAEPFVRREERLGSDKKIWSHPR